MGDWLEVIGTIIMIVLGLAGAGLDAIPRYLFLDTWTSERQISAAWIRHRAATVLYIGAAIGAYASGHMLVGLFIVLLGVLDESAANDLGAQAKHIRKQQKKDEKEAARLAAELDLPNPAIPPAPYHSPTELLGEPEKRTENG